MRKTFKFLAVTLLLYLSKDQAQACTSFAVYSEQIWYGMNFDYPDTDIKFSIVTYGTKKAFRAEFGTGGYIAGINEAGLFSNYQLLYYNNGIPTFEESNTLSIGELNEYSINNLTTVSEVNSFIGDQFLIPSWGLNLHTLFADTTGDAIVVEPFGSINGITPVQNNLLVMTNFPNYDFIGEDYTAVYGVGSDRYVSAYEYIRDHISDFSLQDGFETLSRTAQTTGDYPTQISLLFDPVHMEIFFYLDRDFSRVWKVSFQNETIETYSGFSQYRSYTLDAEGIWASELQDDITSVIDPAIRNKANRIMKMYPNPTSGVFFIDLHSTSGLKARVELYTGQGKLVFVNEYTNQSTAVINLSNNTKGVYLVKVIDNIGIRFDYLSLE